MHDLASTQSRSVTAKYSQFTGCSIITLASKTSDYFLYTCNYRSVLVPERHRVLGRESRHAATAAGADVSPCPVGTQAGCTDSSLLLDKVKSFQHLL